MTPLPAPRALVVINGDDVYEDLLAPASSWPKS